MTVLLTNVDQAMTLTSRRMEHYVGAKSIIIERSIGTNIRRKRRCLNRVSKMTKNVVDPEDICITNPPFQSLRNSEKKQNVKMQKTVAKNDLDEKSHQCHPHQRYEEESKRCNISKNRILCGHKKHISLCSKVSTLSLNTLVSHSNPLNH